MDCIFCKIVKKEAESEIIYEDENILGFSSVKPEAPVHLLFVPKKHLEWGDKLDQVDLLLLSNLLSVAKKIAVDQNIFKACKLIFNIGKAGHIPHIHLHLLGGWQGEVPMDNV